MSLLLDFGRLSSGLDRVTRRFSAAEFAVPDGDFTVVAPVEFDVEVRKDRSKVRLAGRLATRLELECGRCLDPFEVPIDTTFDSLFLPATEVGGDEEVGSDDLGVSYYKNDVIDLGDVIREQLYLALPMKPLCRDDCRGLCPVCGANRNREACACQTEWEDPRFDALKHFTSPQ
jgi:uncharacterized protein